MPKPAVATKHRLTLSQLSAYDDILTDALVDHVYFWTTIRKNKNLYHPSRGITEEAVTAILQKHVIVEHKPAKAEIEMLALPGLKKFHDFLRTSAEQKDFRDHLRRYINIYSSDCPWEVSTTNRYTVVTQEAKVSARRDIKRGETIKYLCGVQVQLSEEEEENIKTGKRDFSIVVSSRSKTASLFLGPARFANHDCDANARLKTTGNSGMEIVAYRDIDEGEEVTVSYGENYFGEDNCECLCRTCETLCRNGWTSTGDGHGKINTAPQQSIEATNGKSTTYSLRRRRQVRRESTSSRSPSMTPDVVIRPQIAKRTPRSLRFQPTHSPLGNSPSVEPSLVQEGSPTPSKRKREIEALQQSPSKKRATTLLQAEFHADELSDPLGADEVTSSKASSHRSASHSPPPSSVGDKASTDTTDATSIEDEETIVVEPRTINPPLLKTHEEIPASLMEQADSGESILVGASTSAEHPAVVSEISAPVNPSGNRDDPECADRSRSRSMKGLKGRRKSFAPISDKDHAPEVRYPGDYVLTSALLSEPAMSWIICKQCEEPFVQKDAYFTRSACPRCERHSKLYGYMWPKTDPEDSEDEEERVLDHRTVHRFVKPAEEKSSRKLARVSSGVGSRAVTRDASEAVHGSSNRKNMEAVKVEQGNKVSEANAEPQLLGTPKRGRGRPRKSIPAEA